MPYFLHNYQFVGKVTKNIKKTWQFCRLFCNFAGKWKSKYNNNTQHSYGKNFKSGNNYPIYLKNKGGNKRARSSSKNSNNNNNNNIIPFIEYNPNNNIITNFMLNQNNNQKLFVKFNKDIQRGRSDNNNIINNNNQFIQNNNFININYYPQLNESKYILYL